MLCKRAGARTVYVRKDARVVSTGTAHAPALSSSSSLSFTPPLSRDTFRQQHCLATQLVRARVQVQQLSFTAGSREPGEMDITGFLVAQQPGRSCRIRFIRKVLRAAVKTTSPGLAGSGCTYLSVFPPLQCSFCWNI